MILEINFWKVQSNHEKDISAHTAGKEDADEPDRMARYHQLKLLITKSMLCPSSINGVEKLKE